MNGMDLGERIGTQNPTEGYNAKPEVKFGRGDM